MSELLELETPPSAVFCCNDHMAIGALRAIKNKGLRVPEDISIIGYDDSEIAKVAIPELTSIQYLKNWGVLELMRYAAYQR